VQHTKQSQKHFTMKRL